MRRGGWMISASRLETDWKRCEPTEPASIRSGSTISGASASYGQKEGRPMSKSSTTTPKTLLNPHPGEILAQEFLQPMNLSQTALARAVGVPPRRINEIVQGKRAITADTDLRLARYFGVSEGMFLTLQADYELMERRRKIGAALNKIVPHAA
jgi:addiction module HigA family antidote